LKMNFNFNSIRIRAAAARGQSSGSQVKVTQITLRLGENSPQRHRGTERNWGAQSQKQRFATDAMPLFRIEVSAERFSRIASEPTPAVAA
jgi:hypothetical protein